MAWTLWVRELLTVYPIPRCMLIRHLFATVVSFPWTCSHTSWGVPFRVYMFLGSSHTKPQLGVLRCLGIGDAIYVTEAATYWLKVNTMLWPSLIFQPWTMDSSGSWFIRGGQFGRLVLGQTLLSFPQLWSSGLSQVPFVGSCRWIVDLQFR